MKGAKNIAVRAKQAEKQISDPRLAALARLLARHAARKDFERERQNELSASQSGGYPSDSLPEDTP